MTESRRKEIQEFCTQLAEKRQQVSDRELLDQCQKMLGELLELSKDDSLEPDPPKEEPQQQSQSQ